MTSTVENLEKSLSDLVLNRNRLAEQIGVSRQQLEINEYQLENFDVVIASVRATLGDSNAIAKVDELRSQPADQLGGTAAPLGLAGADFADASASAGINDQGVPSQG